MSSLSSHVLDAFAGRPAVGVRLTLYRRTANDDYTVVASGSTDADGRVNGWETTPGQHRLQFDTGEWFAARSIEAFYPQVVIAFTVTEVDGHYHVPLLLSPFAYSTYRGS